MEEMETQYFCYEQEEKDMDDLMFELTEEDDY